MEKREEKLEYDELCEAEVITLFAETFGCHLEVVKGEEHYFHMPDQLKVYRLWLKEQLPDVFEVQ